MLTLWLTDARPSDPLYAYISAGFIARRVRQSYDALAALNSLEPSSAHVFTLISALNFKRLVTSRPALSCLVSLHRCTVWCTFERLRIALHSHYSLDSSAEMVATSASSTVSNLVGMIGTEGLSVQTAVLKVQWCVSDRRSADRLPTFSRHSLQFFLLSSISSTRRMRGSSWRHIYLLGMQY